MMIYLKIGNYTNKGDGLMLHAIINRLQDKSKLCVLPKVADYHRRATLGLYQAFWFESLHTAGNRFIDKSFPQKIRRKYGLVSENELDAVLDASGFAYGDQWGEEKINKMADKAAKWKKSGKKVILLPQSLGSFEKPGVRSGFLRLLENTDLIYARDSTSYAYAREVAGQAAHIRQAPDFTGSLKGEVPAYFTPGERRACIIPSHRMIDSTDDEMGPRYLPFLKSCFQQFEKLHMHPFVLVHEKADHEVALQLQQQLGRPVEILYDDDPLKLRGIIAHCHVVISSRFHGLISTLSQGVPCLGTRWSHKFERVMEEYGCEEYLVSPMDDEAAVLEKIRQLDEPESRSSVVNRIKDTVAKHQLLNDQMWTEIENLVFGYS